MPIHSERFYRFRYYQGDPDEVLDLHPRLRRVMVASRRHIAEIDEPQSFAALNIF